MHRAPSSFSAAAKILFDSAQKVGAVGKVKSGNTQYARHLNSIRFQRDKDKKDKGSLNSVASKVSKFLESKQSPQTPKPSTPLSLDFIFEKNESKVLKDQPHLKALRSLTKVPSSTPDGSSQLKEHVPSLDFTSTKSPTKRREESESIKSAEIQTSAFKSPETKPKLSLPSKQLLSHTDLIQEDTPLFEVRKERPELAKTNIFVTATSVSSEVPTERNKQEHRSPVTPSVCSLMDRTGMNDQERAEPSPRPSASLTVDAWERQREKEIERLDAIREAEVKKKEQLERMAQHKVLGIEWVEKRSRELPIRPSKYTEALSAIMVAAVDESLNKLEALISSGAPESIVSSAVAGIVQNMMCGSVLARIEGKERLYSILESKKDFGELLKKTQLHFLSRDGFVKVYHSLKPSTRDYLDIQVKRKAIQHLMREGLWEEALSIVKSEQYSSRKQYSLELTLLRAAVRLEPTQKESVVTAARDLFQSRGHDGKEGKYLLLHLEKRGSKWPMLKQAVASPDADEVLYSSLILCSNPKDISELLAEMKGKGLSTEDPCVKRAILWKKIYTEEPSLVFEEIEQQRRLIGLRPFHIDAAVLLVGRDKSTDTAKMTMELISQTTLEKAVVAVKKILPKLYDRGMMDDIITVWDRLSSSLPLEKLLPRGMAFYNEALISKGRAPLSDITLSDINYSSQAEAIEPEESNASEMDIPAITELLLTLARERDWAKAVQVVQKLPPLTQENSAAFTLLFNCALSSAVDTFSALQEVYGMMKQRGISPNATTSNTMLSGFSRSSRVEESIAFFREVPTTAKDTNTYVIFLSMMAKWNRQAELAEAFEEAKKNTAKLPSSVFALVLGSTVNHSWEISFQVFQDLIKMHGKNVNESLKEQVWRCLEKNGRSEELLKLTTMLEAKKKKK